MKSEWKDLILGDVAQNISRRFDFNEKPEVVFINTGDVLEGSFLVNTYTESEGLPGQAKKAIEPGDILFSEIRPANKRYAFIDFDSKDYVVSTKFMVIKAGELVLPRYLYLILTSNQVLTELQNIAESRSGTFPQITFDAISHLPLKLPNLDTQKKIVEVLTSIDGKIELNRKMSQTLEDMAQTLFKSWFVDFDLVHAKAKCNSDRELETVAKEFGISKETLELFPSEFEESELGDIPKGWQVDSIGKRLQVLLGGTPSRSKDEYWTDGTIAWINSGKVNEFRIIEASELITEEAVKKSSTKLLPKKTTVLAITGATLGQVSLLEIDSCANQSVIGLPETNELSHSFIYPCIRHAIKDLMSHQTGGAQQHINKGNVENYSIVIPSHKELNRFVSVAKPLMDKISINIFESQNLKQIRETLLPKLLSGELDVSQLELDNVTY